MPDQLAGLGPERQNAGRVQAVEPAAIGWVVGLGIAGAPVDEVKLRVIRAVLPCRSAAVFPSVRNVLGPGLGAWLAGRRYGVAAPEMLAGIGIPAIKEPARCAVAARHPGDHNPVRHQRRDDADITFLVIGNFLFPDLFSGLHVERDDVAIERLAKQPTIVKRGSPAHDGTRSPNPRRRALILNRRAP